MNEVADFRSEDYLKISSCSCHSAAECNAEVEIRFPRRNPEQIKVRKISFSGTRSALDILIVFLTNKLLKRWLKIHPEDVLEREARNFDEEIFGPLLRAA